MKTKVLLFAIIAFFYSCSVKLNKTITDERTQRKELIWACTRDGFQKKEFNSWYEAGYDSYVPDKGIINGLKGISYDNIKVKIIFGTWCGDSRRELPRFYKIVDEAGIPEKIINVTAVDTKKISGDNSLNEIKFTRIPTFIFYKNGKEIGRIVESTTKSLEKDMLKILETNK